MTKQSIYLYLPTVEIASLRFARNDDRGTFAMTGCGACGDETAEKPIRPCGTHPLAEEA